MRTIIAGSRECTNMQCLLEAIDKCSWEITEVVCGMARGADWLGFVWAKRNQISIREFPANWSLYGKSAGYRRNVEMAENADALIALWDGKSRGTQHMINIARQRNLAVFVHYFNNAIE